MIVLVIIENSADYFDLNELMYAGIKAHNECILLVFKIHIDLISCHLHVNIFLRHMTTLILVLTVDLGCKNIHW